VSKHEQLHRKWNIVWYFHVKNFTSQLFFIKVLSSLQISFIIRFDYTTRPLRKHDVIKVCSIEYLTTEIELVLPTFKSRIVHNIIEYVSLGHLSSLWNIYHSTTAYFFDPPFRCLENFPETLDLKSLSICGCALRQLLKLRVPSLNTMEYGYHTTANQYISMDLCTGLLLYGTHCCRIQWVFFVTTGKTEQ